MDKIDIGNWGNYFGKAEHAVLHESERYGETLFRFGEPGLATGTILSVSTPGLALTEVKMALEKPLQLSDTNSREGAESIFILEGDVASTFTNIKGPLEFEREMHSIQYNSNYEGVHTVFSKNFHSLSISYDLPYLNGLLQSADSGTLHDMANSIQQKKKFLATPYALQWSPRIADVIHAIRHSVFHGITRYIFIESKMMELFVLQMEHLRALQDNHPKQNWSAADQEKLFAVKEHLDLTYLEPVTLKELTYKFGLNEFKLKKGFKYFFQSSVFGHIHHLRMEKAKDVLLRKQMNVSEVAYFIGYNNVGSFSAEFKKRFGYSPRQM
jgi:AraC family transcriptional activator of pyochelin receptor